MYEDGPLDENNESIWTDELGIEMNDENMEDRGGTGEDGNMDISRIIAQIKVNEGKDRHRIKHQGEHRWDYG